jgi:hypothetical protein
MNGKVVANVATALLRCATMSAPVQQLSTPIHQFFDRFDSGHVNSTMVSARGH